MKRIFALALMTGCISFISTSCQKDDMGGEQGNNKTPTPTVTFDDCETVPPEGKTVTISFIVTNPTENGLEDAKASSSETWAHDFIISDGELSFIVDPYEATEETQPDRTTDITFRYPEAEDVTFTVTQTAPAPKPAELTFTINITGRTTYSFTYECIPSDKNATYILETKSKDEYESYGGDDEKLVADDIEGFLTGGWSGSGTIEENLVSGDQSDEEYFSYSEPCYLIAYGLDKDGKMTTSKVTAVLVEPLPEPDLTIDWVNSTVIPATGGTYEITCTIENPLDGGYIEAQCYSTWIHTEVEGNIVTVTADAVEGEEGPGTRTASLFIYYRDQDGSSMDSEFITLTQDLQ